jgi:hypothetical protein
MLGLPIPASMDGRVLEELFSPGQLAAQPPMYEAEEPEDQDDGRAHREGIFDRAEEHDLREQLRALGYLS